MPGKLKKESGAALSPAELKAAMKMQNDLPPVLEGLSSVDIRVKISENNIEILQDLANAQSEFWKDKEL